MKHVATPTQPPSASNNDELQQYQVLTRMLNDKITLMKSPAWKEYQAYRIAQYREEIALGEHRVAVFKWQEFASSVMLWVVVTVVLAGVVFSGIQLWHSLSFNKDLSTDAQVSAQGFKITSSVVGLIILAMSLAFVVIFVRDIYSVKVIDVRPAAALATP